MRGKKKKKKKKKKIKPKTALTILKKYKFIQTIVIIISYYLQNFVLLKKKTHKNGMK